MEVRKITHIPVNDSVRDSARQDPNFQPKKPSTFDRVFNFKNIGMVILVFLVLYLWGQVDNLKRETKDLKWEMELMAYDVSSNTDYAMENMERFPFILEPRLEYIEYKLGIDWREEVFKGIR
jgi:hypothetical protein